MTQSDNKLSAKEKLKLVMQGLKEMKAVEQVIQSKLDSEANLLEEIPEYLLSLGGKRMRPLLTLLCAKALGLKETSQALLDVSAGIELIHMATLLHDDIIDNSALRRHKQSAFLKYGLGNTLLAGDFLLVRAFSLCARLDRAIINATETACVHLTEGEILEVPLNEHKHTIESSINIARKKTAALFKLATFSGSFLSQSNAKVTELFSQFGEDLGIAFQILDDILDVASDQDLLGKPSGTDIKERKPALVNVLWLNSNSKLAQRLLEKPGVDETNYIKEAIAELRDPANPVLRSAKDMAMQYAESAKESLQQALTLTGMNANTKNENTIYINGLFSLIDYTLERIH